MLPADTQWIVANGGGDKAAVEAMVAGVGATVVHLPLRRWTKGPVQNVGASFAESDRLLLLDCDIEFDRDGWSVMANALEVDTVVTLAKVFDESLGVTPGAPRIDNQTEVTVAGRDLVVSRSRYWPAEGARSGPDRKSTRLNSSHSQQSRMPSSA